MPSGYFSNGRFNLNASIYNHYVLVLLNAFSTVTKKGFRKTSIGSGERVSKDHPRVHAMGAVDHLNSTIGYL